MSPESSHSRRTGSAETGAGPSSPTGAAEARTTPASPVGAVSSAVVLQLIRSTEKAASPEDQRGSPWTPPRDRKFAFDALAFDLLETVD